MGVDREAARCVLGILGNIASCLFFLSSAPTIVRIVRLKSSGGLSGNLYVFKLFNCMLWTFYGLPFVHPHDFWVVLTNSFGCAFALLYIIFYLSYASQVERRSMLWKIFAIITTFSLTAILLLCLEHSQQNRILVVGILCAIISSCMHLTLLSQCRLALQSKDPKYLHPNSSSAAFLKGALWTTYGIVNFDIFIVIPNGIGVVIGVIEGGMIFAIIRISSSIKKVCEKDAKDIVACEEGGMVNTTGGSNSKVQSRRNSMQVVPVEDMVVSLMIDNNLSTINTNPKRISFDQERGSQKSYALTLSSNA